MVFPGSQALGKQSVTNKQIINQLVGQVGTTIMSLLGKPLKSVVQYNSFATNPVFVRGYYL